MTNFWGDSVKTVFLLPYRPSRQSMSPIVSSLIYRQIELSETAAAATLAREVFDQFVAPYYQPEGVTEFHRYASDDALSQRHKSGHITLVAEHSGELVGMLHLREPCHVSMLFVQSSRQRGGIGRGLLAAAGALAGDTECEFTVSSSPNAVAAYERLGFRITGSEQCIHGIRFVPMQRLSPNDRRA
jgi:GNAT superfamily N-acetyltransferase